VLDLACVGAFVAVVETRSVSAAAQRLGLSQSGVSQQLARLETALGASLVQRGRKACVPSAQGLAFLPFARELLALEARARAATGAGRLAIGVSGNIAAYLLPDVVQRFARSQQGRGVEVEVSVGTNPQVLERLGGRLVDVALTEWWDGRPDQHAGIWRREPMVLIVPPEHRWAKRRSVALRELAAEPLIGGEPGSGTATLLRQAFGKKAADLPVRFKLGSTEGVKRAVLAGLGVSIVMESAVRDELRAGRLVSLRVEARRLEKSLYAVRRADAAHDSAARRFAGFVTASGRA
jgi:DNA-binding transcriptional LysR family regulator